MNGGETRDRTRPGHRRMRGRRSWLTEQEGEIDGGLGIAARSSVPVPLLPEVEMEMGRSTFSWGQKVCVCVAQPPQECRPPAWQFHHGCCSLSLSPLVSPHTSLLVLHQKNACSLIMLQPSSCCLIPFLPFPHFPFAIARDRESSRCKTISSSTPYQARDITLCLQMASLRRR